MSEPVETYTHAGMTVEIHYDETPENPRTERYREQIATIYQLNDPRSGAWGDERSDFDGSMMTCPLCEGYGESETRYELIRSRSAFGVLVGAGTYEAMSSEATREPAELTVRHAACPRCNGEREVRVTLAEYIVAEHGPSVVWLPIDHWDDWRPALKVATDAESADGYIVCDAETVAKEWDGDREAAKRYLSGELEEYSAYLQGDVYGYVIKLPDGEAAEQVYVSKSGPDGEWHKSTGPVACWGFIGDLDGVRSEANAAAESVAEDIAAEDAEREAMAARDIETH